MPEKSSAFKMNFDAETKNKSSKTGFSVKKRLFKDLRPFILRILLFTAVSVLFSFTFVKIPRLLGDVIDVFVSAVISSVIKGTEDFSAEALKRLIPEAVIFFAANAFFAVLQGIISTNISSGYSDSLRKKVFKKIGSVRVSYFDVYSKEYVMRLSTEKTDGISQSLNILLSQVFSSAVLIVSIAAMLFKIDIFIGLCVCLTVIFQIIFNSIIEITYSHKKNIIYKNKNTSDILELYSHLDSVKHSGMAETVLENIKNDEENKSKTISRSRFISFINQNFTEFLIGAALAAAVIIEYPKINESVVSIGTLISIIIYLRKLAKPLSQITSFSDTSAMLLTSADSLFRFLDEKEEGINKKTEAVPDGVTSISIDNITFRYPKGAANIFENYSVIIPQNGITVIQGLTGNGKSTLIKLILGMYEPDNGKILYGEADIKNFDIRKYREKFFVISQEATLFEKSIAENIAYPDEKTDYKKATVSAKLSGADGFIKALPQKYNTVFRPNPQNLSDGQIQQILLAQALYHNKRYIILDEATSFIDSGNEKEIYDTLKEISSERGIIIITHRKNNIGYADKIIEI